MEKVLGKKVGRKRSKYTIFDTCLTESSETDRDFKIVTCAEQEVPSDIRAFYGHPLTAATHDAHGEALALLHEYRSLPVIDACQDRNLQAVACMIASERNDDTSLDMPLQLDTTGTTSGIHLSASSGNENHLSEILKSQVPPTQLLHTDEKTTNLPMNLESTINYDLKSQDAQAVHAQCVQSTDFNGDHCVDSNAECTAEPTKHNYHKRPVGTSELKRPRKSRKLSTEQAGRQHRSSKKVPCEESCAKMVQQEWTSSSENALTCDVKCLEWLESAGQSESISYCVQNMSRTDTTSMASGTHVSQSTLPEMRHSQPVISHLPSSVYIPFTTNETWSKYSYSVASDADDRSKTITTENVPASCLPGIRSYMNHGTIFQNVADNFTEQSQSQSQISDDLLRRETFFNKHCRPSTYENCFHRDTVNMGTYSDSFSNIDTSSVKKENYSDFRLNLPRAAQQYPADFPPFGFAEHTSGHCDNYAVSSSLNLPPSNILPPMMCSREIDQSLKQYSAQSAANMPQMPFPMLPVPPGYRLVITHHQLPNACDSIASASSTSPQVTRLIIDHPSNTLTPDHGNAQ